MALPVRLWRLRRGKRLQCAIFILGFSLTFERLYITWSDPDSIIKFAQASGNDPAAEHGA
jgi:hypothetical protein